MRKNTTSLSAIALALTLVVGFASLIYADPPAGDDRWFPLPTTGGVGESFVAGEECECQYQSGDKGVIRDGDCIVINCWTRLES